MTDLSALSDAQLQALYDHPSTPDVSKMSDADLMAAYHGTPQVGMGEDALKSTAAGLGNATIGTLGMGGDIRELASKGVDALGAKLGFDPAKVKSAATTFANTTPFGLGLINNLPTSQQVKSTISNPVVSPDYQPQTGVGSVLKTGAEFLPAMVDPELAGPGAARAAARLFATRVAAPALASEGAGTLTNDNPYAKTGAALLTAAAAPAAFNRAIRAFRPGPAEATVDELKAAARSDYNHADVANVRIAPQAAERLADTISSDLQFGPNSGFRPTNSAHAPVFNEVENLRAPTPQGAAAGPMPKTVADLDNVRQGLGNLAKERDAAGQFTPAAVAAQRAIGHIDNFLPNLQQGDLLAGDAQRANAILQRARENWGAAKRAENVQTLASNAEINAASANSGGNIQNATKQAFKPMLKNNAAKAVGYNDQEIAALNSIVRGTWTGSAARAAGNVLGGGGGLGMLIGGAAGYHEGGIPGAIAAGLAGRSFKMIGNRSTLNAVGRLDRMLRARSPEAVRLAAQNPQIAAQLPPAGMRRLQALIIADPLLSQQVAQPVQANSQ